MEIKAYTNKELANLYGINYRAWLNWIKPLRANLGLNVNGFWNPDQVEKIVSHLGLPSKTIFDKP